MGQELFVRYKMQIEYTGHAGFIIKDKKVSLLLDCWNSSTCFVGNLKRYPNLKVDIKKKLESSEIIYIWCSHSHTDHYDKETISELDYFFGKKLRFLSQDFMINIFERDFPNIPKILFKDRQIIKISDNLNLQLVHEKPTFTEHSIVIAESNNEIFIHGNDSIIDKNIWNEIDINYTKNIIYSGQYSRVSPYPFNQINLSKEKYIELYKDHLKKQKNRFLDQVSITKANKVIPCAGPGQVLRESIVLKNNYFNQDFQIDVNQQIKKIRNDLNPKIKLIYPQINNIINQIEDDSLIINNLTNQIEYDSLRSNNTTNTRFDTNNLEVNDEKLEILVWQFLNKIKKEYINILNFEKKKKLYKKTPMIFLSCEINNAKFALVNIKDNKKNIFKTIDEMYNFFNSSSFYCLIFGMKTLNNFFSKEEFSFEESWYGHDILTIQSKNGYSSRVMNRLSLIDF